MTDNTPVQYRQSDVQDYAGRTVQGSLEQVDYLPGSHFRIWYNCQMEGYAQHHHAAMEMIRCLENGYTVTAGGRTFNLSVGDILLIPSHMLHRLLGNREGARFVMLFDPEPLALFLDYASIQPRFTQALFITQTGCPELYAKVSRCLDKIVDYYFQQENMWEMFAYAEITRMYASIGRDYFLRTNNFSVGGDAHNLNNYSRFAQLLSYIDEHYAEDISLDQAAERVGLSRFHFSRLFREYTGTTFTDHLMNKRIHAAQELLSENLSVTEVAYKAGFHNLATFSRSFKKCTGLSPRRYRSYAERYRGGEFQT